MRQCTQAEIAVRSEFLLFVFVVLSSCQTAEVVLEGENSRVLVESLQGSYGDPAQDSSVLDAVVRDILTNSQHEDSIAFYGGLVSGSVGFDAETFPSGYHPVLKGFSFRPYDQDSRRHAVKNRQKLLVLRIQEFAIDGPAVERASGIFRRGEKRIVAQIYNGGFGGIVDGRLEYSSSFHYTVEDGEKGRKVKSIPEVRMFKFMLRSHKEASRSKLTI